MGRSLGVGSQRGFDVEKFPRSGIGGEVWYGAETRRANIGDSQVGIGRCGGFIIEKSITAPSLPFGILVANGWRVGFL